jgi:hypothetical protein
MQTHQMYLMSTMCYLNTPRLGTLPTTPKKNPLDALSTWYRLSEKLSALMDKYQTLVSRRPPVPYQSHHRSASGTKRPASPLSGGPDQLYKKSRSFRAPAIFILFVCAVCLGRHCHDIAHCNTSRTWDQRSETFAEHQGGNLFARQDGRQICYRWQRTTGCNESHCPLHICSGCGSKSHNAQLCPKAQKQSANDAVQGK